HHVDIQIFPFAGNFLAQFRTHIHTRAVNGNFVDERVRASKVYILKQARIADRIVSTLTGKQLHLFRVEEYFFLLHLNLQFQKLHLY
ncbi:hypothetical protein Q604_UNBC14080G0001, partial [human gut metagenome]